MMTIAQQLHQWIFSFAKNRDGFDQEEARDLFFKFRRKKVLRPEEPEEEQGGRKEPGPPQPERVGEVNVQLSSFMRETSEKLDRIEDDIDYLKKQVDTILKKI
jgi:hypothetical protein